MSRYGAVSTQEDKAEVEAHSSIGRQLATISDNSSSESLRTPTQEASLMGERSRKPSAATDEAMPDSLPGSGSTTAFNTTNIPPIPSKPRHRPNSVSFVFGPHSSRCCLNLGTLIALIVGVLLMFMGYPMFYEFFIKRKEGNKGGFNLGGVNMTGQVPDLSQLVSVRNGLIDRDTPQNVYRIKNMGRNSDETWNLVFSDEFNTDGRSFYPGEDPFWEAVNLYAHGTADLEWYDPAAVTTKDGALLITASNMEINNLNYRSGQVTSWNQFCFTGGYLEAAVILPGDPDVSGWWPAIWTMGNLGRANYGATTEGTWPFSYDTCDRGTLINQTDPDGLGPPAAITSGNVPFNGIYKTKNLSWQPGQKLSACTCPDDDHPGPKHSDGSYVGRSAPELDLFEAQVNGGEGSLSLSCQYMPATEGYNLLNTTGTEYVLGHTNANDRVQLNSYQGSVLQMAASAVAKTNQQSYQNAGGTFSVWGVEYEPGPNGWARWYMDGQEAWTLYSSALGYDPLAGVSQRPMPDEPMYIIMNLAISHGFGAIDWDRITFPGTMQVDYVRVYQAKNKQNIGCDPPDRPTSDYINRHWEAYTNPNYTIWGGDRSHGGYGALWPRNRLYNGGDGCSEQPRNYPGRFRPNGYGQGPYTTVPYEYRGVGNNWQ
ncbi:SKN1-domain-containing protein [Meira miltonrushii]|uniref:SKN1-domain-containing protein n=1 Tax=Meira miltonrushii TaxID=1280837 RepID=A0A316VSU5_9BASI|nr:SKN1-domain-containing protein [Meira miltonrushii]PWN38585.1 SKN1-domain-containing protein [Meira miltonrushii]